jgi:hypothetical protein
MSSLQPLSLHSLSMVAKMKFLEEHNKIIIYLTNLSPISSKNVSQIMSIEILDKYKIKASVDIMHLYVSFNS